MRKPSIKIVANRSATRPWVYQVKWPGNHWKNSQKFSFEEALLDAGLSETEAQTAVESLTHKAVKVFPHEALIAARNRCQSEYQGSSGPCDRPAYLKAREEYHALLIAAGVKKA